MKRYLLVLVVLVTFCLAAWNFYHNMQHAQKPAPIELTEEFNPSLYNLENLDMIIHFVDSLYGSPKIAPSDSLKYSNLMARTLRMCFYHGWSKYGMKDNWVLYLLSPIHPHSLGIVEPNDILKYPQALCSQQAIVGMMALRYKGYTFRKVGFYNSDIEMGHFTYEIKLRDGWHFYDLDLEPNLKVMEKNNRPSIDSLASNDKLRRAAYSSQSAIIKDKLISHYNNNHPINVFPAKNMLMFHRVTLFLSYTLWLWIGMFFWMYRLSAKKDGDI